MKTESNDLYKKIIELHSSSYLSLMSITQGVAVGFLALNIVEKSGNFNFCGWLMSVTTAMVVILTWNEYVVGMAAFDWVPHLSDSAIPFLLCGAQIGLACNLDNKPLPWVFTFAVFSFVAFVAFVNMYCHAAKHPRNRPIIQVIGKHREFVLVLTGGTALTAFIFYLIGIRVANWVLPVIFFTLVVVFVIRTLLYWQRIVRFAQSKQVSLEENLTVPAR